MGLEMVELEKKGEPVRNWFTNVSTRTGLVHNNDG